MSSLIYRTNIAEDDYCLATVISTGETMQVPANKTEVQVATATRERGYERTV